MTKDKARKRATRERAGGTRDRRTEMSYTEAHRLDRDTEDHGLEDGDPRIKDYYSRVLPMAELEQILDEAEQRFRSDDPYERNNGFSSAAKVYEDLVEHAPSPTWAMAARMAAQLYAVQAARVRFEHQIPTIFPRAERQLLHLGYCDHCGRPWQAGIEGACDHCPRLQFGPTPHDAEAAKTSPRQPADEDIVRGLEPNYEDGKQW